jgi:septum site-determining protein MinC
MYKSSVHVAVDRAEPFQLKGSSFTLLVLKVLDPADDRFFHQLGARIRQAPQLFRGAPVIIDLTEASGLESIDAALFTNLIREHGLVPIGVQGVGADIAQKFGLAIMAGGRGSRVIEPETPEPKPEPKPEQKLEPKPEPKPEPKSALVITEPVRSGRRVYSRGDLIVMAPVSQGAELLADGHIHIYSTLRGRAIAGLNGDRTARIFCQSLQAELVSIAGLYRVMDDIDRKVFKKSVKIHLEADRLCIDLLS